MSSAADTCRANGWEAIHRRMLTNASLATSKALEGLILQSADETGDLISTLESDLARVTKERDEARRERDEAVATIRSGNDYMRALEKAEASERRTRNECSGTITDLTTQLARANAAIERVRALHVPMESLVWESHATPSMMLPIGGTMAPSGIAAARQVVRTFCRQCDKAFPCPTRTILEGNGA